MYQLSSDQKGDIRSEKMGLDQAVIGVASSKPLPQAHGFVQSIFDFNWWSRTFSRAKSTDEGLINLVSSVIVTSILPTECFVNSRFMPNSNTSQKAYIGGPNLEIPQLEPKQNTPNPLQNPKRNQVLLGLVLLGLIGYGSYRGVTALSEFVSGGFRSIKHHLHVENVLSCVDSNQWHEPYQRFVLCPDLNGNVRLDDVFADSVKKAVQLGVNVNEVRQIFWKDGRMIRGLIKVFREQETDSVQIGIVGDCEYIKGNSIFKFSIEQPTGDPHANSRYRAFFSDEFKDGQVFISEVSKDSGAIINQKSYRLSSSNRYRWTIGSI